MKTLKYTSTLIAVADMEKSKQFYHDVLGLEVVADFQKRSVTMHTVMNKTTGILLFVLPLTVPVVALKYSAPVVCMAATFAAIQEGHYIRTGRDDL